MAKRDEYMTSSSRCSRETHKRLLQDSSGYAQDQAKKKLRVSTRTEYTYAPYHDGYQWRKYGQKMIRGNTYPRYLYKITRSSILHFLTSGNNGKRLVPYVNERSQSLKFITQELPTSIAPLLIRCCYRCTYHQDHVCPATKHVEQTNSQDPPLFRVIYTNEHTCISTDASSIHIQQMADVSLRKAEMELLSHCNAGHQVIKEEEGAIVSSLLGVINNGGCDVATSDVMRAMQENTAALLSSNYSNLSSTMGRSSHEGSPSSSPVLLPASEETNMDFVEPLESHWFEPLDLGWFIEPTRMG